MKKQYLSLVAMFLLFCGRSTAQLVGANCFLQGTFVECGIAANGSCGPGPAPAGYHTNGPGTNLAMVYDWGHDGWGVGAPTFYGDYTYPGTPFEGWSMQVNGARSDGWYSQNPANIFNMNAAVSQLSGSNTSYAVVGGIPTGVWTGNTVGTSGGLQVRSTSRVEPNGSWIIFTVEFTNTTGAPLPGVYYWRTCDPDNAQTQTGSFSTQNLVVYQNDAAHRVMVSSVGASPAAPNAYLALGTKDCRAKAMCYNSWAAYPAQVAGNTLDRIWAQTATNLGPTAYAQGTGQNGDYGIGLVYNIGTINPGQTAVISYAYIFNGNVGIDEAFPEPLLVVNGVPQPPSGPAPAPTIDTLDICGLNLTSLPVHIDFGSDKNWTNSSWTWSPSTGLSSTTGTSVVINPNVLPSVITYTITGNDSNINMMSCNYRMMYLTILTCGATVNDPCLGDTLKFNVPGDSTNVSYQWYGPGPGFGTIIDTNQGFFIYPTTWADSGLYHVIKIRGSVADTYQVTAVIHPLPVLNMSSSIPLCGDINDSLQLGVLPSVAGNTYLWSGPNGFSSTQQFPLITPFDSSGEGIYYVYGTSSFGCKDTSSITVYMGITPGFDYVVDRGCFGDTVYVFNQSVNALTYNWDFGQGTGATTRDAMHVYPTAKAPDGIWNIKLSMTNAHCTKDITHQVNTRHTVLADFVIDKDIICFTRPSETTTFTNNSNATVDTGKVAPFATVPGQIIAYDWSFGFPGATSTDAVPILPVDYFPAAGIYPVTLTVTDSIGCKSTKIDTMTLLRVDVTGFDDTTLCLRQPMYMDNMVTLYPPISGLFDYQWTESPTANLSSTTIQHPYLTGFGVFTDVLRATIQPWQCWGEKTFVIHSVLGNVLQNVTLNTTIPYGTTIQLNAENEVYYHWIPNDGTVDNPNINNPNAAPLQTTTYTIYGMDQYGCVDSAFVTITVDSTLNEGIPSAFTPNGDGLNDVFRPIGLKYQRLVDFRIFNRWGEVVYATADAKQGWDGTWNGKPQDLGVYHYHVIVAKPDGTNKIYKGDVTLIR